MVAHVPDCEFPFSPVPELFDVPQFVGPQVHVLQGVGSLREYDRIDQGNGVGIAKPDRQVGNVCTASSSPILYLTLSSILRSLYRQPTAFQILTGIGAVAPLRASLRDCRDRLLHGGRRNLRKRLLCRGVDLVWHFEDLSQCRARQAQQTQEYKPKWPAHA